MSDIQEQIKIAHKRAEENDIKILQEELEEILDRLERIDHKEYIAFDFADSATFDEMARCFEERKKMADYITNLQEENEYSNHCNEELRKKITNLEYKIERLKEELQQEKKDFKEANDYCFELKDYKSRNEKAIELIKENVERCRVNFNETQDIKWLDYIEIYGFIEYELKGDNK